MNRGVPLRVGLFAVPLPLHCFATANAAATIPNAMQAKQKELKRQKLLT